MNPMTPVGALQAAATARNSKNAGATVRRARLAAGLTLADLGRRCGYSASQISRYERGIQPLTDITLLRRLAEALAISPQTFGLAPQEIVPAGRHAPTWLNDRPGSTCDSRVNRAFLSEDGEDPVRRRELLSATAGLAGVTALSQTGVSRARSQADPAGGIQDLLYSGSTAEPVPAPTLRAAVIRARTDFQAAHYDRLALSLPRLIATGIATRDGALGDDRAAASSLLADAYISAANLMIKLNDDPLAWAVADRALQAALVGDDPLTVADARRVLATVMRRTGRRERARELLISAANDIEPKGDPSPERLSMYGTLLEAAAYTAAVDGSRPMALSLIGEAKEAASRLGRDANHRFTAFGPSNVVLHQLSIAQVLGDSGTAIEHARAVRASAIPTAERRGRYWIDVARSYHQWGKSEPCFLALLAAERAAPAEVRYRPPVHRITEDLLRADHRRALNGLRSFARRIGVPAL